MKAKLNAPFRRANPAARLLAQLRRRVGRLSDSELLAQLETERQRRIPKTENPK
jgi:hypothetical protein